MLTHIPSRWSLPPATPIPPLQVITEQPDEFPVLYSSFPPASDFTHGCVYIGESNGTPLQYSCLGNTTDRGAWWATVHGVAKSWTRLSDFTFTFHFHALEKEMATHSSVLAWRIPGTEEPGGLPSMGSHRETQLTKLCSSSSVYMSNVTLIHSTLSLSCCVHKSLLSVPLFLPCK